MSENIFEMLGFDQTESAALKLKADIYTNILSCVKENHKGETQHKLSTVLDIPQPKVSDLLRGNIAGMSLEKLIGYLEKLSPGTNYLIRRERRATS